MIDPNELLILKEIAKNAPMPPQAWIVRWLWLIPALPILASGVIALLKQPRRKLSAFLAIGSLTFSLLLSLVAFGNVLSDRWLLLHFGFDASAPDVVNFTWIRIGSTNVDLGWVLDPLSAVMLTTRPRIA